MNYLSQEEIDALIKGIAVEGTPVGPELQPFNFRRPPRVPRDRQVLLDAVYARLAQTVQSYLSDRLRQTTDVALVGVELVSFGDFRMSLGNPCSSYLFSLGDISGSQGILDLDARFATHLVDRLFGGPGSDADASPRAPTGLEQQVLMGVAERLLSATREAWADHLMMAPTILSFEISGDGLRIVEPEDNVLAATLAVRSGIGSGLITLCLPLPALEVFLQQKTGPSVTTNRGRTDDRHSMRKLVEHHLRFVQIPVTARMPEFRLSAMDVAGFQVGQILETGHSPQSVVELQVSGKCLFHGTLGRHQGAVGLRVSAKADRSVVPRPQRRKVIP